MILTRTILLTCLAVFPTAEPTEIGFGCLSGFDYVEGMELPAEVTKYDDLEVRIPGFMRSEDGDDGPTETFMLINETCGCDGTPLMNEIVFCTMPDGKTVEIGIDTKKVTGTLYVGEETEDGIVMSIYRMDVDKVE